MLNANIAVTELVLFGAALGLRPYKLIEVSRSVRGMGWLQLGEDVGGVE